MQRMGRDKLCCACFMYFYDDNSGVLRHGKQVPAGTMQIAEDEDGTRCCAR